MMFIFMLQEMQLEHWNCGLESQKRFYVKYWNRERGNAVSLLANEKNINDFNLNKSDFDNIKYEDDPVEVFLNLK